MNSKQGFKFEVPYCIRLISEISKGKKTKEELKEVMGAGENKIIVFIEWLKYIEAINLDNGIISLTKLGEIYLGLSEVEEFLEPLMLYHLLRDSTLEEKDGQFYFSELINTILNKIISGYENNITAKHIQKDMLKLGADEKYPSFISSAMNALSDPDAGFGKMGILEEIPNMKEPTFEVHSYWVEPLVAAYIIYDMWEESQTAMGIDKIINEKYNLGRMFLMDKEAIMETLEEIQQKKLINIELASGLNQVRTVPGITKYDILDMMIKEA